MICPKCQFENPEGHRFCGQCGNDLRTQEAVAEPRPILDAERKRVTALFSDISGYTAMTSKLDPEEVKEITSRIFDGVKKIVGKYDGFIERFAGDGVLALFGVPKAHEDDPIRAVRAAGEIHELVESLSPRYESKIGRPLSMHSGVNTGLAVTADVDPTKGTHGVTGDAINVAARLSDLAQAREILVGPDTYKSSHSHFTFQPLTPTKVKGKSEPILIYKVLSAKAPKTAVRLDRQVSSEMVGRDPELAKLELQILKAVNGEGSVVNVIGEAGIGKSRLIAELKKRDVMKRVTLLEGRAISMGKNLSFHPIIDLLKQWAGIAEDDNESSARDKLATAIRRVCGDDVDEVYPFVATMMGMKLTGRHAERVKGIEGEGLEKLIVKNVRELVIKGSEQRPSAIIMEDLHWADTSSIELLGSLYRLAEKHNLVFINVFRPGYFESDDGKIETVGQRVPTYYNEVEIQPLNKNDSETLINNMLEIKGFPYSLKEQIVERAGGNPFFIEEVVRSLIDEGAVVRRDGRFEVTEKIDKVVIPPTINRVLIARIDRLEEKTRELVKVASIIGRSFFHRIIKDVASFIEDLDDRLAYLKDTQLIRERIRLEELEYLFKHALAQEAAYESTLVKQRRALHLKIADSIERVFQEKLHEFYGMLAYHYSRGEDLEKAEEYMTKAGDEALRISASGEALHYCQEALKLYLDKHGEAADPNKVASLEKKIAIALHNRGQYENALRYFDRVLERRGVPLPRSRIGTVIKMISSLLFVIADLYLPRKKIKNIPDNRDNEIFDLSYRRIEGLPYTGNNLRFFAEIASLLRRTIAFDIRRVASGTEVWMFAGAMFAYSGLSFSLGKRCLERSKLTMDKSNIKQVMECISWETLYYLISGEWNNLNTYESAAVDLALKSGCTWTASMHIWVLCVAWTEQGKFDDVEFLLRKQFEIGEDYDHDVVRAKYNYNKVDYLIKLRKAREALIDADAYTHWSMERGMDAVVVHHLGFKTISQIMENDARGAKESMLLADEFIAKQGLVPPLFLAPYVLGRLLTVTHLMEQAVTSGNRSDLTTLREGADQSSRAALRNARKYAPFRILILRLTGVYYWLIGKQGKAMKWWDKAIKEGERLGARPDLSRTYFEVGKRMLEPHSKYKQLNGIDANGYLEKAGILFEEMGLERDLEDLERVRMEL